MAREEKENRENRSIARRESYPIWNPWSMSPFALMRRFTDEMDRMFEDFGTGRLSQTGLGEGLFGQRGWSPDVEVFQRGNELVVRADLPGLSKDDLKVELSDDQVTISGERREEHTDEHEGYRRSERRYGSFFRSIPLPEGVISDSAKASFKNGVLEVVMQAPPSEVRRGRRLEIHESSEQPTGRK